MGGVESSKVSTGKAAGDNGIRFADPIALPSNPAPQRPGLGWAVQRTIGLSWAVAALALVALANCSSQPASIVADDEALCRYSAATVGPNRSEAQAYANCRARIGQSRTTTLAANASAIQGYALIKTPTEMANPCAAPGAPKDCSPEDLTGSINPAPKPVPEPKR
ncbi:MAG: hypothetical protein AB7T86_12530 [Xanthobacteraceae bacterium]|uniref:hypothetical protein n=1 Tax=Pseudolabrys sp. TaxID=1960880 RepID=UPI003D0B4002